MRPSPARGFRGSRTTICSCSSTTRHGPGRSDRCVTSAPRRRWCSVCSRPSRARSRRRMPSRPGSVKPPSTSRWSDWPSAPSAALPRARQGTRSRSRSKRPSSAVSLRWPGACGRCSAMTKRERVMAALRGAPVDRVPVCLWLHNFAMENSAADLASETLRLARRFDWDFLKPQSRAQCFAEMWGLRYAPSRERATSYTITRAPLTGAADLRRLQPADVKSGALGEQLQALLAIRQAVGPDTPIIWTIFAPLMVLPFLLAGSRPAALELMRTEPAAVDHALAAMAVTLAAYAHAAV